MRKYYYLSKGYKWSKPLNYAELIYLIITKKIRRFSTVWHTGLCSHGDDHPTKCIHPSINAIDIPFIPNWFFSDNYGFSIYFKQKFNKIKSKLGLDDGFAKFANTPLEMPSLLEQALVKTLTPSIRAIHNLSSGGEYSVELTYPTRDDVTEYKSNTYKVILKEVKSNFIEFQIILPELPDVGGVLHKESYGLNNELILTNEVNQLRILPNSVADFSTKFPFVPQILRGQFTQINQVVNSEYKDVYIRLILPPNDKDFREPISILERSGDIVFDKEEFNIHDSLMGVKFRVGSGYSELIINNKRYHYYSVQESMLIIECLDKNDLNTFKLETEQIRLAFAVLSGNHYQGETYYLSSHSSDFTEIEGVWYEKEPDNILTANQIINPRFFFESYKDKDKDYQDKFRKYHNMFPTELFAQLCNTMLAEEEIQRAIQLIVSGSGNTDPTQKGALYSVAIETLTNHLSDKNDDKLKPINDKELANQLLEEIKSLLPKYTEGIGEEGIGILGKKISNLNQPTNRDKLTKPFEIYGLELSERDLQAINRRNDYLHGRSPLNKEEQFELNKLTLELHYLAASLVLKFIGYEGHTIYLPYWSIIQNQEKYQELFFNKTREELELFRQLKDALGDLQKSIKPNTLQRYEDARVKLRAFYDSHEIKNIVKFI